MDIVEVCSKLFRVGCENGLLPRGAIGWGEMYLSPSIVAGKPLVEAHRLEASQEWAGISLCDSMSIWNAEHGLTGDRRGSILGEMKEAGWLVPWLVPTKCLPYRERLAVNWLIFDQPPYWHKRFAEPRDEIADERVRMKLANTEAFYRYLVAKTHHVEPKRRSRGRTRGSKM
jgi:hypothetical protein